MTDEDTHELGPLAALQGVWEGVSRAPMFRPDDDRTEIERNAFRERLEFEPTGLVENHEQSLYGLRYFRVAWRLGAEDPFHEQVGYWLWDAEAKQVMLSFVVPRGICVLAGGPAEPDAKSFRLEAEEGSDVFGISSGTLSQRAVQDRPLSHRRDLRRGRVLFVRGGHGHAHQRSF